MKKNPNYPLKHVSIRVPWHDNGWDGTICNNPKQNNSCLVLKNCALHRDDEMEEKHAGESIKNLKREKYPCCVNERGTFMCNYSFDLVKNHPYTEYKNEQYSHFKGTDIRYPSYSAAAIPFLWMQRDEAKELAESYDLDLDLSIEPDLNFKTNWLQEQSNQKTMLDTFFQHLEVKKSLCFFYAKDVPFVESPGRILIGVGRVKHISDGIEYDYSAKGGLRSMLWEHMIQHSIRPEYDNGFILPYYEALEYSDENSEFDPSSIAVITPADKQIEFSYATEHVSNDTAIRTLLECEKKLEEIQQLKLGNKEWTKQIKWVHDRINELEKLRGDYPGLGSVLTAFGIKKGHFVAREIIDNSIKADAWELVDKLFENPESVLPNPLSNTITDMMKKRWKYHKNNSSSNRIKLLQLISRFDINIEQVKNFIDETNRDDKDINLSDRDILRNPYLIYEESTKLEDSISFWTIDLGMFSSKSNERELLPLNVDINGPLDERRVRALTFYELSKATNGGHTLLSRSELISRIKELPLIPECEVAADIYEICEDEFKGVIEKVEFKDGEVGYQLSSLKEMGELIESTIRKRKNGNRHQINIDWRKLLDEEFEDEDSDLKEKEREERARQEKAAALKELSQSRFSVLTGSAGTGKTTILSILCSQDEIKKDGILFLAPTGKARMRMEETAEKIDIHALTLAQFLYKYNRYDSVIMDYVLSDSEKCSKYGTVIIDEASMLTERMLAALIDSLKGVKRLILVGDYRQLPPIGPGRPFVDIVDYLKTDNLEFQFPKVGKSYAELTINRRQKGDKNRSDMTLAKWFSGTELDSGDDLIFQDLMLNKDFENLTINSWKSDKEFESILTDVLVDELELTDINDVEGFNKSLGSNDGKFFNDSGKDKYFKQEPTINGLDDWQILSPVRGKEHGTDSINRFIHQLFRKDKLEYAKGLKSKYPPRIPRPLGNQEIVYGDKVMNIRNHPVHEKRVYPNDGLNYISNGEMGYVVGQFKSRKAKFKGQPKYTKVEFSSQKGYKYTFYSSDFTEEGDSLLELAYAITIHKSQGSEFEKTFIILPKTSFILSRELIYTALTRQKDRVVIIYQGENILDLKEYSSDVHSEILSRVTNLFKKPSLKNINGKFLEEYLIHCASDNTLLRSKSELIIYEKLLESGLEPIYEKELKMDGIMRIPDFTIMDDDTGQIYYWEHCGMLTDPIYKDRWQKKEKWYYENGILPLDEGGGPNGVLIQTKDSSNEGLSIPEIEKIIKKIT